MKTTICSFLFALVLTTGLFAQQTVTNEKHERVLTHVEQNIFDVQFLNKDGNVVQEGQYWKEGNKYKPHGTWILYAHNSDKISTKAVFEKGVQISVETEIEGELVTADKYQLAVKNR